MNAKNTKRSARVSSKKVTISNDAKGLTKQLLAHLPKSQTILFCGDSGFFNGKLFDLLDQFGHGYLVKVKLKGLNELLFAQAWEVSQQVLGRMAIRLWKPSGINGSGTM